MPIPEVSSRWMNSPTKMEMKMATTAASVGVNPRDAAEDDDRSHERPKPVLSALSMKPLSRLEIFRHGHVPAEEEAWRRAHARLRCRAHGEEHW